MKAATCRISWDCAGCTNKLICNEDIAIKQRDKERRLEEYFKSGGKAAYRIEDNTSNNISQ